MRVTNIAALTLAALIFATPVLAQPEKSPQMKREFLRDHPQARMHMKKAHKFERKAMRHRMKARGEMREWRMENGMPPFGQNFGGPNCPSPMFDRGPMMHERMRGPNFDCPQGFGPNPGGPQMQQFQFRGGPPPHRGGRRAC